VSIVGGILHVLERRSTSGLAEPADWLVDAIGGESTHAGKRVTPPGALSLIPVLAAVKLLAGAMAQCPMVVYRGEGRDRERAKDTWQWRLLHDRPNDEHAADIFYETIGGHENLWGNYYAEKVKATRRGVSVVDELWPLAPTRVSVERDSQGRKVFHVDGDARTYTSDTILHIPAFGYDGLKGLSPISLARQEIAASLAMQEFVGRNFANNAHLGGVIQLPDGKTLSEPKKRELAAQWRAMHNLANAGATAVLEDGASWQSIAPPLKDLEFVALNRFSVGQVARLFQVPPEMIGGDRDSSMTYSTVEGQALHFVKFSLARWLIRVESALRHDRDLFPESATGLYPKFNVEGLLRGDTKNRYDSYAVALGQGSQPGFLTVNEIRELEERAPVEGGDVLTAPLTFTGEDSGDRGADGNGHDERREREMRELIATLRDRPAPVLNPPPVDVRIERGAIEVNIDAPPAPDVRVEAPAAPDVRVEVTPEIQLKVPKRQVVLRRDDGTETTYEEQ